MSLIGDLKADVEVVSKAGSVVKITASAIGILISTSDYAMVTKNDVSKGFKFYGTAVNTWIETQVLWQNTTEN